MDTAERTRRRPRFFYGWVLVLVQAVQGSFAVGTAQFASSTFLPAMQQELGWSRTLLFGALSVRGLVGGALAPLAGPLADHRWLPRVILPAGVLLLGGSFILVKWVHTPLMYYLAYGVLGALASSLGGGGFLIDAILVKWFLRKRAQALMWSNLGPATGPLLFPIVLTALIGLVGWRDAWLWLGVGTVGILLPLSLLVRTRPEEMGLLPDGDLPGQQRGGATWGGASQVQERSFTSREAMRTSAFWMLTAAMAFGIFGVPGFQAHWIPYFLDLGFSMQTAASAVLVYGVFTVVTRFLWGYLSARYHIRLVLSAQALVAAVGVVFLLTIQNAFMLFAWAVYCGLTLAGFFQLQALLTVNYFGREHIGAIRGMIWPFSTVSSSVAPLVLGALRDWQGSYVGAFALVVATWLLCGALVFFTRPLQGAPQKAQAPAR
jgi:sugar phosphate permease